MAFDGITIKNIIKELKDNVIGGRIFKIAQTETDELILTIKNNRSQYRILISANATLPLIYLVNENKPSPLTAPNFCMMLRKHINNGRITDITQPGLERIIEFHIEHLNELGDICHKKLICELMGKHSNIIFVNEDNVIIDSIKHISALLSSVREVLPGKTYFIPNTMNKQNPMLDNMFFDDIFIKNCSISKAIYTSITGFSPILSYSICKEANVDIDLSANLLNLTQKNAIIESINNIITDLKADIFSPRIYSKNNEPVEYSSIPILGFEDCQFESFTSISQLLYSYYSKKNIITRMRQKSFDLRRVVTTNLEKDRKKYGIQLKQLDDTEKKEKYKIYGELLTTYGYNIISGSKSFKTNNYYTGEDIVIPLDSSLSPIENAKKYFEKYSKLKRTAIALNDIIKETKDSIEHLESVLNSIDIAMDEDSLKEIRSELVACGYIKKSSKLKGKKEKITSSPMCYISKDGYKIYVGKNNYQNDELTFNVATGNDWWFHAKGIPGSHVIVKNGNDTISDDTFEEAAKLAAYYSKGRTQDKVEIDYTQKKNIKKVAGAKPGFVIYHTNYSMLIDTNINDIKQE